MSDHPPDPFDGVIFDEDFVRCARHKEPTGRRPLPPPPPRRRARRRRAERRGAPVVLPLLLVFVLAAAVAAVQQPSSPGVPPRRSAATAPVEPPPQVASPSGADTAAHADPPRGAPPPLGAVPPSGRPSERLPAATAAAGRPTPQPPASPHPLGRPQPGPEPGGPSTFLQTQDDGVTPIAYDPCRPLRYVVNHRTAPPEAEALLAEAIATISTVTGLQLHAEGATEEAPSSARASFQPDRYGDRWAPILIAWSDEVESPDLAGDVAGTAGSVSVRPSDRRTGVYVTGTVTLDGPQLAEMLHLPEGATAVRGVLLHELAHLVGLGHVDEPSQLMHAYGFQSELQSGDLAGLVRLGTGPCMSAL